MSLDILTKMSNKYGSNKDYVLAGGGNTSFKADGVLYVKSSGTMLSNITPPQFVQMNLKKLTDMLDINRNYPADDNEREADVLADMMAARLPGQENKRPSVEAILHAMFPYRYVLHLHPAMINGLTCGKDGANTCAELFGSKAVWIGLTKPGYVLAELCNKAFEEFKNKHGYFPQICLMQNHGIFYAADSVEEIHKLVAEVDSALEGKITTRPDFTTVEVDEDAVCKIIPALRMLYSPDGNAAAVFCANKQVSHFVADEITFAPLTKPWSPDHIVYCKDEPLFIASGADVAITFKEYVDRKGYAPRVVALKGLGFVALGSDVKQACIAKDLFIDAIKIAVYAENFGGASPQPDWLTDFILSWEIEQYRSKQVAVVGTSKRLAGKIAVVTGSAQGFGKGIAESMAAEGAHIVIADINADGAKACSDALNAVYGENCSIHTAANVTDEDSVKKMINTAVMAFGGLDILVSNAGVLTAGSVFEVTKSNFDFVTAVNYTGYFLCVKHAAAVMKTQNDFAPDYLTDIIEINSKSGLEGSNKNFAYAGSKFGGVGLTQSFAMELIEYGIKVNAICPGNFLDGPLWSDPEKGLFKQYLDANKVKGAKTIADVRKSYEERVPMKRGCDIIDVARAIFYVVEQKYETGQAIPVTGGQVMLK